MKAINKIEWKGHTIEFIPVLSAKYLWIATANKLRFDGKQIATSGGFCLSSNAKATVQLDGISNEIEMRSSSRFSFFPRLNYSLLINGEPISKGIAKIYFW